MPNPSSTPSDSLLPPDDVQRALSNCYVARGAASADAATLEVGTRDLARVLRYVTELQDRLKAATAETFDLDPIDPTRWAGTTTADGQTVRFIGHGAEAPSEEAREAIAQLAAAAARLMVNPRETLEELRDAIAERVAEGKDWDFLLDNSPALDHVGALDHAISLVIERQKAAPPAGEVAPLIPLQDAQNERTDCG